MSVTSDEFETFVALVRTFGVVEAARRLTEQFHLPPQTVDELVREYERRASTAREGYPPRIIALPHGEPWYAGPLPLDPVWPPLRQRLSARPGWSPDLVDRLDQASTKIVAYTKNPATSDEWRCMGLVVGHVQSGKTTNFTAVIAKAVDLGYNLVIVLAGIHNGLRRQTQQRLLAELQPGNEGIFVPMTTEDHDFRRPTMPFTSLLPPGDGARRAVLCVVKKNAAVLRKLLEWLRQARDSGGLRDTRALVIDDEADLVSVQTARINPLIRDLLNVLPRRTFLGYTATPFANVLIDPTVPDDLYPRDFILSLPREEHYFGAEKIFGRDEVEGTGGDGGPLDGYDMVRKVPDPEAAQLRPTRGRPFTPSVTPALRHSLRWFLMATAARKARGDQGHATMLVHTSMRTSAHRVLCDPIRHELEHTLERLRAGDPGLLAELHTSWEDETRRVRATDFGLPDVAFDEMMAGLAAVIDRTRIVIDNSRSDDRLRYDVEHPVTAIAIGGNTLSRGLTLEGLVVSFFVRSAGAYDTLMQMGRWFGYRAGYEDLSRIWMTDELRDWFRHLATVEHEIRTEIERYDEQSMTPLDVGVRIRTHPVLLVTQKLGAARLVKASFAQRRVQTRYLKEADRDWLSNNLAATDELIAALARPGVAPEPGEDGSLLWRDVDVAHVQRFLARYAVHEDSPDLDTNLVLRYIEEETGAGSLLRWSVALMAAADTRHGTVRLGGRDHGRIARSKLKGTGGDKADIKTLMSKEHRVRDLPITPAQARRLPEDRLKTMRDDDPDLCRRGLLLLYPIDPRSLPDPSNEASREALDAVTDVIGVALVFPNSHRPNGVDASYVAVDLSAVEPLEDADEDLDELIERDSEDDQAVT